MSEQHWIGVVEELGKRLAWEFAGDVVVGVAQNGGLWEVYPAMMAVPFAAGVSILVHAIVCFATWPLHSTRKAV